MKRFYLLLMLLWCSITLFAQSEDTLKTEIAVNDTITLKVMEVLPDSFPLISVIFTAQNQLNEPLWNLDTTDFTILENQDTCKIEEFAMLSRQVPVNIALVIDHSGSMALENGLDNARYGILRLLRNLNMDKDSIIIIGFSDDVDCITPLTNDTTILIKKLWRLKPEGLTAYYDAINIAIDSLEQHSGLKAVIALTDGNDNSSLLSRNQIIEIGKNSDIPIHVIGLGLSEKTAAQAYYWFGLILDFVDPVELQSFAEALGGSFYYTKSSRKLTDIYYEINRKIRAIYEVKYSSSNFASADSSRDLGIIFVNGYTEYDAESLKVILPNEIVERLKKAETKKKILYGGGVVAFISITGIIIFFVAKRKKKETE